MATADLYIRVSTDEQAVKGFSQRSQEERLNKYCSQQKIEILRTIVEDHSAKSFNRPAWSKAMTDWNRARANRPDLLLFTQWDRFSRNAGDAYYMISKLKQLGIEPKAIEQPTNLSIPENKMMLALYLASSEVENDRRSLNIKHGLRKARQEGRWPGHAPMGYLNVTSPNGQKHIIPHEPEATIIRQIFNKVAEANYSLSYVYRYAIELGLKCSNSHFQEIIRNPFYCGKVIIPAFDKEKEFTVKGLHEKIISEELFNQVQKVIASKKKTALIQANIQESLPLRGFLVCPHCGRTLTGSASKGHLKKYFYYHCSKGCPFRVRADNANNQMLNAFKRLIPLSLYVDAFNLILQDTFYELYEKKTMDQAHTIKSMEQLIDRIIKAREALYTGAIDSDDFITIKDDCEKRINILGIQLQHLTAVQLTKKESLEKISKVIFKIGDLYDSADIIIKRQIISLVLEGKAVYKEPADQMLSPAFQVIFNIGSGILNDSTNMEFASPIENESSTQCEELITTRLALETGMKVSPSMVKYLAESLRALAIISLKENSLEFNRLKIS